MTRKAVLSAAAAVLVSFAGFNYALASSATADRVNAFKSGGGSGHETAAVHSPAPASHAAPAVHAAPAAHAATAPASAPASHGHEPVSLINGDEALAKLIEGNVRFMNAKQKGPNRTADRRTEVAAGQHPFAIVVTCSDSRVPPEILFDQGIGDVFVVRTAGNVVDDVALGSIEYAIDHLGAKLVLVLGHTKCGAVGATVAGGDLPGHLPAIAGMIQPAVESAKAKPGDLTGNSIKANVKLVAKKISAAVPQYAEMIEDGELRVAGGVYDLETGKVTLTYRPTY